VDFSSVDFVAIFVVFLVLVLSLSVHEAAHAWSADRLGDPTARLLGRVSFNPAVHVDPIGTILFPLIALFTGAPVLGWAKPVPVNTANLRHNWKQKFMVIAAAGPASNLVLALVAALCMRLVSREGVGLQISTVLFQAISLNLTLAVFNMIPIPPLDGGNVLAGLLRGSASELFDRLRAYGFLILYALMFTGLLGAIMSPPLVTLRSAFCQVAGLRC
jgi:Zn-dependent protease